MGLHLRRKATKAISRAKQRPSTPGGLYKSLKGPSPQAKRTRVRKVKGYVTSALSARKARRADKDYDAERKDRLAAAGGSDPKPAPRRPIKKAIGKAETALINRQYRLKAAGRPNVRPASSSVAKSLGKSVAKSNPGRAKNARAKIKDRIKNARGKVVSRVKAARRRRG